MKTLAFAFLLFATAAIEVNTGRLADGATQTYNVGSRMVAVYKSGDTTTVRVQEGGRVDTVTLTRAGGKLSIGHKDNGGERRFIVVDRPKVVVDGIDLEPYLSGAIAEAPEQRPAPSPRATGNPRYYICPKDQSMLRVPHGQPGATYKCPVDGTEMKSGTGPQSQYWLLQ
jgi:hypothetical protein